MDWFENFRLCFAKFIINFRRFFQILFFICILGIEFLATTSKSVPIIENSWDKANHFIAFGVLYVLLSLGFKDGLFVKFYVKFCVLLAFGIQIEVVQSLLPNRYFSLLDIVADMIGLFFGVFVILILEKILKINLHNNSGKFYFKI